MGVNLNLFSILIKEAVVAAATAAGRSETGYFVEKVNCSNDDPATANQNGKRKPKNVAASTTKFIFNTYE
jgi:hypothetical protein